MYHATEEIVRHKCCYRACVLDEEEVICECFDIETAQKIADALNNKKGKPYA
jgi:hypothetical protein